MVSRNLSGATFKLPALFVLLSAIPLLFLGWLGYRVLLQDRALEAQRLHDRLENAASLLARELEARLTAWEELLLSAAAGQTIPLPADAVFLLVTDDGVAQQQGQRLPYFPRVASRPAVLPAAFADAETREFRDDNPVAALATYRAFASAPDEFVRAEALMRIARCLRKQHQVDAALEVYANLAGLHAVVVAGSPAELVGRRERVALLSAAGRADEANRERVLLASALVDGRFVIDRTTFEYFDESSTLRDRVPPLAAAVDAFWAGWMEQPAGRRAWSSRSDAFVSVWRTTASGKAAIVANAAALTPALRGSLENLHVGARFDDQDGTTIWGEVPSGPHVTRATRETGLPWTLHVAPTDTAVLQQAASSRRNLFVAGFGLMALVVSAASYFVFRAVNRELSVARLQSDFVAAVSHEFRTPLTAMCHLTEMLEQGDATTSRLPDYYRALGRESRRLHAMVENLLDFGRMDSGRRTYEFEATDASELVEHVAQEYADRSSTAAQRIAKSLPLAAPDRPLVRADREALALAVRNLIDNAMKYSPASSPVKVSVASRNGSVVVAVEDRGAGIGPQERRAIFGKFTRGAAATALNVKGTGIGLTMAEQIVKAHGGRLEVESEVGRGSTFTIVLPAVIS